MIRTCLAVLVSLTILNACSKENKEEQNFTPTYTLQFNTRSMVFDSVWVVESNSAIGRYDLIFSNYSGPDFITSAFSVNWFTLSLGLTQATRYIANPDPISPAPISAYISQGLQGETCQLFGLNEADSTRNSIEITEYNPTTKEIKGKVNGVYVLKSPLRACPRPLPDTMMVVTGTFHTLVRAAN